MATTFNFPVCLLLLIGFFSGCGSPEEQEPPQTAEAVTPSEVPKRGEGDRSESEHRYDSTDTSTMTKSGTSGDSAQPNPPVAPGKAALPETGAKPGDTKGEKTSPAGTALDPGVIAAWRKAGALAGWLAQSEFGAWQYLKEKPEGVASLPVFLWRDFAPGTITRLPAPSAPFAMGLGGTGMSNAGLKELAGLKNLQSLDLSHTQVTDAGLRELAALKRLHSLDLGATVVTDAGLKELAAVKSLQKLYLGAAAVTGAGLKELAGLKNLQTLYLYKTQVTDEGLKELAGLQSLRSLLLYNTQVTDAGLKELAGLRSLRTLGLISTAVTDAGLKELAGFKNLQALHLANTQVTDEGVAELARVRPGLSIVR